MPRNFTENFYGPKGTQRALAAPGGGRGRHNPPWRARSLWRALLCCALCGPPFAVIPTPKNHIYSKIILHEILLHLDFV